MNRIHIITMLTAAGILLPSQQATGFTSPIPEIGDSISFAPKKKKKKKQTKAKGKNTDKTAALAKQIFNPTDEQKRKAAEFLTQCEELQDEQYTISCAIKDENDKIVYAMLITGADPQEALCDAAVAGKVKYVKLLLHAPGIDVNKCAPRPALHDAVTENRAEVVRLLLATPGIDVNILHPHTQETPLASAVSLRRTDIIRMLIQAPGVDMSAFTPLETAILKGDKKEAQRILKASDTDINKQNIAGQTPLICAIDNDSDEIAEFLLSVPGIDVNATDKGGDTALSLAIIRGKTDITKKLLTIPNIDINKGDTPPINAAAAADRPELLKLLMNSKGISYNRDNLFRIAVQFNSPEVVKFLLKTTDIDPNGASQYGYTHLALAASQGNAAVVKVLLSIPGVDVNKNLDESKWQPPFGMAIQYLLKHRDADPEVLKVLLNAPGIDANKTCPLHSVAWKCREDLVKILVSSPVININLVDGTGRTALHEAVRNHWAEKSVYIATVKALIDAGIDVNIKDEDGKTALMLLEKSEQRTEKNGRTEVIKLLKEAGAK